jgi:hypothetical protein
MLDLLREAERAGAEETACVNDSLFEAFDHWLSGQELEGIRVTKDETDALRRAFDKGFGICVHNQA